MKKRISALVLALLMMVSLFGCAPKEELYAGGSVSARTYENALLGLQCIIPADWSYLTEAELLQLGDVPALEEEQTMEECLTAHLNNGGQVQDMYAMTEDGLQTVNVMVTKIDLAAQEMTIADFADLGAKEVREVYEEMGITEVNMSREQVDFLGETVEAIRLSGAYEDVPLYSLQLCLERGSYLCVVTFNSYVEDTTETLMKFFRPFVAEEEEK